MFIEFSVKNFRSLKETQVLSMTKTKGDEHEDTNCFNLEGINKLGLVKSLVIYGANASGKSNLIHALIEMKAIVNESASESQEGDSLPLTAFLFDKISPNEPTEFEIMFIADNVRYQYGFSATRSKIIEEWLIAYPKGRAQRWFSRLFNEEKNLSEYKFSDHLQGQKSIWQSSTRSNALFLSTAVQLNSDQLKPIFNWFKNQLRPAGLGGWKPSFSASLCDDESKKDEVLGFLKSADISIHDIQVKSEKFNLDNFPDDLSESFREKLQKELKDKEIYDIKTIHKTDDGELFYLEFDEESDGTKKLFSFAGPWLDSLKKGYILVIDELNDNLHPKLVRYLIGLFHSTVTNPNNAQLIFTTHDTSILNQDVFRRDQIWFCEKNKQQATSVYPLSDFNPRKGRENIELGYLTGRYGALPFINFNDLK
ncbi:MAG: ATP-binding protein [Gammaproteobacteria bacterium]|nr:ATP-binding protein [Gammaproteobacteria bacterium]